MKGLALSSRIEKLVRHFEKLLKLQSQGHLSPNYLRSFFPLEVADLNKDEIVAVLQSLPQDLTESILNRVNEGDCTITYTLGSGEKVEARKDIEEWNRGATKIREIIDEQTRS